MDVILHTGVEHPNLLWIIAAAVISFAAGTGFGAYLLKPRLRSDAAPSKN